MGIIEKNKKLISYVFYIGLFIFIRCQSSLAEWENGIISALL